MKSIQIVDTSKIPKNKKLVEQWKNRFLQFRKIQKNVLFFKKLGEFILEEANNTTFINE